MHFYLLCPHQGGASDAAWRFSPSGLTKHSKSVGQGKKKSMGQENLGGGVCDLHVLPFAHAVVETLNYCCLTALKQYLCLGLSPHTQLMY